MEQKVLVIGLDGATWDLIKPWADDGKLPAFKKLMENGVWGELESTMPPFTIPAWNSMTSGKNPGNLGFSTFFVKDGYNFRPHNTVVKKARDIWDILSKEGKKVCIANVPNILSTHKINGYMVAGWLYRDEETLTYPRKLKEELDRVANGYKVDIFDVIFNENLGINKIVNTPSTSKEYLNRTNGLLKKHSKAFKYLLREDDWDFGFVVFVAPDRIQHRFWNKKEVILGIYQKIDRHLKSLLENVNEDTVVVLVSDHGFGSGSRTFNVNEWLIKEGYLKLKDSNDGFKKNKIIQIIGFVDRCKLLPMAKLMLNLIPSRISKPLMAKLGLLDSADFDIMDNFDWSKTKAFGYRVFGSIYLNVTGREPEGIIAPEDYENTRNNLISRLNQLKQPGTDISPEVYKREEIYKGKYLENMPDLVIKLNDNIQSISAALSGKKIFTKQEGGDHRVNGIFLAHGPRIKKGTKIDAAKIYDITPTILHIFGLPIPEDMDGRVLKEIFEEGSELAKSKIIYQEVETEDEKELIKERIKKLKGFGKI